MLADSGYSDNGVKINYGAVESRLALSKLPPALTICVTLQPRSERLHLFDHNPKEALKLFRFFQRSIAEIYYESPVLLDRT